MDVPERSTESVMLYEGNESLKALEEYAELWLIRRTAVFLFFWIDENNLSQLCE